MVLVIPRPVICPEEDFHSMPRGLNAVGVGPGVRIDEVEAVVDGVVRVTHGFETAIRAPAVADDCRAWFDPFTYKCRQRVSGSVRHGNKKYELTSPSSAPYRPE